MDFMIKYIEEEYRIEIEYKRDRDTQRWISFGLWSSNNWVYICDKIVSILFFLFILYFYLVK